MSSLGSPTAEFKYAVRDQMQAKKLGSIGCFIKPDNLQHPQSGSATANYRISPALSARTLYSHIAGVIAKEKEWDDVSRVSKMSPNCVFQSDCVFAEATGFLVQENSAQDLIVATAGHVAFETIQPQLGVFQHQVKTGFQDYYFVFGLTNDSLDDIPASNVWGVDRVLFGQKQLSQDMYTWSNDRPAINSLDEIERPDWALVRLKALGPSKVPSTGALELASSASLVDGTAGVWLAGHPWGTSMKTSNLPEANAGIPAIIRTKISAQEKTAMGPAIESRLPIPPGKGYEMVNIFRHNARATHANSGSPMFLGDKVIGILDLNVGRQNLHRLLFQWDEKPESLIKPYFPENTIQFFASATKNDIFASLISTKESPSEMLISIKIIDEAIAAQGEQGTITVTMIAHQTNGSETAFDAWKGPGSSESQLVRATLPPTVHPYDITKVEIYYEPPALKAPAKPGYQAINLKRLQVICRKPGDTNPYNYNVLFEFADSYAMTDPEQENMIFPVFIQLGPWLNKIWRDNLSYGPMSFSQANGSKGVSSFLPASSSSSSSNNNNNNNNNNGGGGGSSSSGTTTRTARPTSGPPVPRKGFSCFK